MASGLERTERARGVTAGCTWIEREVWWQLWCSSHVVWHQSVDDDDCGFNGVLLFNGHSSLLSVETSTQAVSRHAISRISCTCGDARRHFVAPNRVPMMCVTVCACETFPQVMGLRLNLATTVVASQDGMHSI